MWGHHAWLSGLSPRGGPRPLSERGRSAGQTEFPNTRLLAESQRHVAGPGGPWVCSAPAPRQEAARHQATSPVVSDPGKWDPLRGGPSPNGPRAHPGSATASCCPSPPVTEVPGLCVPVSLRRDAGDSFSQARSGSVTLSGLSSRAEPRPGRRELLGLLGAAAGHWGQARAQEEAGDGGGRLARGHCSRVLWAQCSLLSLSPAVWRLRVCLSVFPGATSGDSAGQLCPCCLSRPGAGWTLGTSGLVLDCEFGRGGFGCRLGHAQQLGHRATCAP